jgi:hypothetical protein
MNPNNNYYGAYYQQMPQQRIVNFGEQQPQNFFLRGRPVSSIEEAKASSIDFDGSTFYFPDVANKRIYTKQIGPNGNAIMYMYEQKEIVDKNAEAATYATKEELQNAIEELKKIIENQKVMANF